MSFSDNITENIRAIMYRFNDQMKTYIMILLKSFSLFTPNSPSVASQSQRAHGFSVKAGNWASFRTTRHKAEAPLN